MTTIGGHFWQQGTNRRANRQGGTLRSSTFMPSFAEVETSFWRVYGWKTVGALFAGLLGVASWMLNAVSPIFLGGGAFVYVACSSIAVVIGFALPIHYYRRHRLLRAFDGPEEIPDGRKPHD